jgi:hypothetical protein
MKFGEIVFFAFKPYGFHMGESYWKEDYPVQYERQKVPERVMMILHPKSQRS